MRQRRGMTIVELLISLVLFSVIISVALQAIDIESRAFRAGVDQMSTLQNYRYALNALEKDLRTVGSGVPGQQPFLVYADGDVVAFNADYASNVENDVFAVYSDTSAPDVLVSALRKANAITIPTTLFTYPDTSYTVAGTNSPAETIIFFVVEDTTAERDDVLNLYRQANGADAELLARSLVRNGDEPFFHYYREVDTDSGTVLEETPSLSLPLRHLEPIHNSPADSGTVGAIDGIRAIGIDFLAWNGRDGEQERLLHVSRTVRLPNAGTAVLRTCGATPLLGSVLQATLVQPGGTGTEWLARLEWNQAIDEAAGESDVIRYVIWRRLYGTLGWSDPLLSIPAGSATYTYVDARAEAGNTYEYAVAAQDCTPSLSSLAVSAPIYITP